MATDSVPRLRVVDGALFMRNIAMRLPFRYGKAVLVAAPLLHLKLTLETPAGKSVTGVAADMLPPKWFDKSPAKTFQDNIADLLAAVKIAGQAYHDAARTPVQPFELWTAAHSLTLDRGRAAGLNGLTAQFGSSLYERAALDAFGKSAGEGFHSLLRSGRLGIHAHPFLTEIGADASTTWVPAEAPRSVFVRHTIGLGDPLCDEELDANARRVEGLPVTVESWIREAGIRYFKIKVSGNTATDEARLESIQRLLQDCAPPDCAVTVDGNEQFHSMEELQGWWQTLSQCGALAEFWPRVLYFEQPVDRARAFDVRAEDIAALGPDFPPLLIDESDDAVDSFHRAAGCGYRGVSAKNCKGVFKSILNAMYIGHLNARQPGAYFLSAEDLCNQPIVPLQQDLCVASALGITHAERNGHHYAGLMNHVSEEEIRTALSVNGTLYEAAGASARLRIREGRLDVSSLHTPGLGAAGPVDFEHMTPLDEWRFSSLGIEE
ncbi:MAG: hypothetical protein HYV27_22440 [Candidatus Hydrogenedentes bacterium]|nr:hypothetical protein [Candidatus Hydrogenedentota bacterium]